MTESSFKVGMLVRVKDDTLHESNPYSGQNCRYVKDHGYLHMVISNDEDGLKFKSVSTGHEHRFFFDDEVEGHDDD